MDNKYTFQNKYLVQNTSFHESRRWLLSQSFFVYKLLRFLRHELKIPLEGFTMKEDALNWEREHKTLLDSIVLPKDKGGNKSQWRKNLELVIAYSKNQKEVFRPIYEAIDKFPQFQLEFIFLRGLVLGYNDYNEDTQFLFLENQVYTVQSFQEPITEFGVYIKYSPWLSDKEFLALKNNAQYLYNYIFNIEVHEEKRKRNDLSKDTKYFLAVEGTSITAYVEHPNYFKVNFNMEEVFDIVSTSLKINESVVRKSYYRVQKKFYLPNIAEASKIPSL